jgi:hypothetical protein
MLNDKALRQMVSIRCRGLRGFLGRYRMVVNYNSALFLPQDDRKFP